MTIETAEKLICPFGQNCNTDHCMAWRWNDTAIKNEGYCGLAGKEGGGVMDRQRIYDKYQGRCAYTGKPLGDDWQVDHIIPRAMGGTDDEDNLVPVLSIVNHYKRCLSNQKFKTWLLAGLNERLKKLPKNPKTERGVKRKNYMLRVADAFGITEDTPFCGKLWFEGEGAE